MTTLSARVHRAGVRVTTQRRLGAMQRRALRLLLAGAAALTVVDGAATFAWLRAGHAEGNPLIAFLVVHAGAGPAMLVRVLVGLGLLGLLHVVMERSWLAPYGLAVVTGALLAVGGWHGWGVVLAIRG